MFPIAKHSAPPEPPESCWIVGSINIWSLQDQQAMPRHNYFADNVLISLPLASSAVKICMNE